MSKKFPLNTSGLLMMNYEELCKHHEKIIQSFQQITLQEGRINQWERYVFFVRKTLGIDIIKNPELDPFKELSGFTAYDFIVKKWDGSHPNKGFLGTLNTDFLSVEHLQNLYDVKTKIKTDAKEKNSADDEGYWEDPFFLNEYNIRVGYRPVGRKVVNDNWEFRYGTIVYYLPKYHKGRRRPCVQKGIIFLEPEPLHYIMKSQNFSILYRMLCNVASWMSHDVLGHMTLDFYTGLDSPEVECYKKFKQSDLHPWEVFYGKEIKKVSDQRFLLDEHRRGGAHLELSKIFLKRNPMLGKMLKVQMSAFWIILNQSTKSQEVISYFMKLYIFCMIRIVPYNMLIVWMRDLGIVNLFESFWQNNEFEYQYLELFANGHSGAPYNKLGIHVQPEEWTRDNIEFISHKEFFTQVHERMV